jgi:rRNA-processing protein FCF1
MRRELTKKKTQLLVVDASVVQSAGETEHPVSSSCRNCLEAIRIICHRVAVTPTIMGEWNRHMSRYSRKWRVSMAARKKPLQPVPDAKIVLDDLGLSEEDQQTIKKDSCLLQAAFSADRIIVTRDNALRLVLSKTPQGERLLQAITWIDPVVDGVAVLENL